MDKKFCPKLISGTVKRAHFKQLHKDFCSGADRQFLGFKVIQWVLTTCLVQWLILLVQWLRKKERGLMFWKRWSGSASAADKASLCISGHCCSGLILSLSKKLFWGLKFRQSQCPNFWLTREQTAWKQRRVNELTEENSIGRGSSGSVEWMEVIVQQLLASEN